MDEPDKMITKEGFATQIHKDSNKSKSQKFVLIVIVIAIIIAIRIVVKNLLQ